MRVPSILARARCPSQVDVAYGLQKLSSWTTKQFPPVETEPATFLPHPAPSSPALHNPEPGYALVVVLPAAISLARRSRSRTRTHPGHPSTLRAQTTPLGFAICVMHIRQDHDTQADTQLRAPDSTPPTTDASVPIVSSLVNVLRYLTISAYSRRLTRAFPPPTLSTPTPRDPDA
ncbi:hypothetical protein K438DRAFT_1968851 [Mycena galopus ATCC 62051]|nr:hypothetical protein K438DRAFT_1968851 [Mycena galopus ATCC 62051]